VGGTGQGAPDQGRDLEATFYTSDPDGEPVRQRWWIEAKGRSGTVEKDAVVSSAQNISAFPDVDIVLIVTNIPAPSYLVAAHAAAAGFL
jgi:hypothetical protein